MCCMQRIHFMLKYMEFFFTSSSFYTTHTLPTTILKMWVCLSNKNVILRAQINKKILLRLLQDAVEIQG